jgi:hypothetical protein
MQPETPNGDKVNSIYRTLLARKQGGDPDSGYLNEAILRALKRSYTSFARRFPELVEYIFDSLGNQAVTSEVIKFFIPKNEPSPSVITRAWADLLPYAVYEQSSSYLLEAATTFIESIYFDFLKEPILKPLLKNKYDVSLEQLSDDLTDDLTNPAEAQEPVPNHQARAKTKPAAESQPAPQPPPMPIEPTSGGTQIVLTPGMPRDLTPEYLASAISPYLVAIANLQLVIDEILKRTPSRVRILSISQNSPITISLDGASDAINLIAERIVPWRQKHAESMAQFKEQSATAEIEDKKAELLEKRARAEQDRQEAGQQRAEAERLKLEVEKLLAGLSQDNIQLVLDILNNNYSDIQREVRIGFITKFVPPIEAISMNDLDITVQP